MYRIKNDKRSIQSCQMIYQALAELMRTSDFETITIQRLAKTAHVGRATFYRYFDNIEDVLHMKCDDTFNMLKDYFIDYHRQERTGKGEEQFPFFKPFLRFWYNHSEIIERLIEANRMDIFTTSFTKMVTNYSERLSQSKSNDNIDHHFDYFLAIRTGVAVNILIQWIKNDKDIPPDDLAELVMTQFKASADIRLLL